MKERGEAATRRQIGVIELTVTRKEHVPVWADGTGTFGDALNEAIFNFYKTEPHGLLTSFAIHLEESEAMEARERILREQKYA